LPTALQNAMRQQTSGDMRQSTIIPIAQLEREAILNALRQLKGDKLEAAKKLGMGKTTLYRKIREYHLEDFGLTM
jgi:two-component system response regulator HydG